MFGWLFSLLSWFTGLWEKLPDSTKESIISMITDAFDAVFRAYYRSKKESEGRSDE